MSRLSSALSAAAPALFLLASLLSLCLSFVTAAADSAAAAAPAAAAAAAATATVAKVGVTDLSGPLFLGILPPACYTAIFTDLRLDAACVKFAISKGLGYGIIAGSFLLKLPQIINILRAKSAEGMILSALYLETLSYAATSTYNLLTGTPLSTYAEALVILVQNCIIVALCWRFAATSAKHKAVTVAAAVAAVAIFLSLPPAALPALMAVSVLTSMSSRVQQIAQNFAAKSTGILSLATTVLQTGGCAARIFTTLQEVDDVVILGSFLLAFALNAIVLAQIFLYWGKKPAATAAGKSSKASASVKAAPGSAVKKATSSKKTD